MPAQNDTRLVCPTPTKSQKLLDVLVVVVGDGSVNKDVF